jgi:ribosomal protein L24E
MMKHFVLACLAFGLLASTSHTADTDAAKDALKKLNEFVGKWKGDAKSATLSTKDWKETAEWGWNLKGGEPSLVLKFDGSKQFNSGVLKYSTDKKKYQLTFTDTDKKEMAFEGEMKGEKLILNYTDKATKDLYTVEMSTNNEGARFVYNVLKKNGGVGIAKRVVEAGLTKEGASLAGGSKNECIVTGGLGTMSVSYNGKTYYVCCSGCRDEFNANPKKYVDEFEKSKKK